MFDITNLVVCFAAVFCFASLSKSSPVEPAPASRRTMPPTCEVCRTACNCAAAGTTARCTCHERMQMQLPVVMTPTGYDVRAVRSVEEFPSVHHVLKRERRCSNRDRDIVGASRNSPYDEPPAPANRKLREDMQRRLAEIRTRIDAIRSLAFLGYKKFKVVARPRPQDATADYNTVALDTSATAIDEDAPQSVEENNVVDDVSYII